MMENLEPRIIEGGLAVDDRGRVSFVNGFDFVGVRRFYSVSNHSAGFIRAWHGHKKEAKCLFVPAGAAIAATVKVDNWESPSKDLAVQRFVLSAEKPSVLLIPPGYVNGFKTLRSDTVAMFFSSATLEESGRDDFRFPSRYWDPWDVVER